MKSAVALFLCATLTLTLLAADAPTRPKILGLSHVALAVHDLDRSRAFYKDFLGFQEPYSLTNETGHLTWTWIKINDHQTIELFPEKEPGTDRLDHVAFETDDVQAMRDYLQSRGIAVPPKVAKSGIGDAYFTVKDPDGHTIEFTQYLPDGWTMLNRGKSMPDNRISTHLAHAGILVSNVEAAQKFYEDILGFHEVWRGGKTPNQLSWIHEQVPDGKDDLEFMLYSTLPAPDRRGSYHHLCLEVPDIEQAKTFLEQRPARMSYDRPLEIHTGVNRKRQLNLYDPDGTRVELMEPKTVDAVPPPR
ncbi:MAG TPA: VOC family protein [Verrucomicrobiae bacterium]|jgi:lactoylglutathione lyase|nr:VOC family protein [Verrucomicrobiae bacterium]